LGNPPDAFVHADVPLAYYYRRVLSRLTICQLFAMLAVRECA
jgi:hypothetical protein